jgi:hypothetical protein
MSRFLNWLFPLVVIAFGLFTYCISSRVEIARNSQTFDEAVHLGAGYSYWKTGDFRLNIETPPLSKLIASLPLLFLDLPFNPDPQQWANADEWLIGKSFLYDSPIPFERLLTRGRTANCVLGFLLILLVLRWCSRFSLRIGLAAPVFFLAIDPNLIAMATVITSDMALTLFSTLSFYCLWEYQQQFHRGWLIALGISLGLMLGSKFSAIFVIAAMGATILLRFYFTGVRFHLPATPSSEGTFREMLPAFLRVGLIAMLTLLPLYFFVGFPAFGQGFKQQLMRNAFEPPKFFFLGEVTSEGSLWYFPFVFLVKTPATLLVGLLLLSILSWRWRIASGVFLLPAGILFALLMLTKVNLGVRVIAPIYPLLYVWAGFVISRVEIRSPRREWLIVTLAVVVPFIELSDSAKLSYFNRFAGGWQNGHKILGDSNLDWGQDLPALQRYLTSRGNPIIYLSYAGTAPPRVYGIRYQQLPAWGYLEISEVRVPEDQPLQLVAISITNLQGTYLKDPQTFAFLKELPPTEIVGETIWIFDLSEDAERLKKIREMGP